MSRFTPPSIEACIEAIGLECGSTPKDEGSLSNPNNFSFKDKKAKVGADDASTKILLSALTPDPNLFQIINKPKRSDWLAEHKEAGQTYIQYTHALRNVPDSQRDTIYIVPLTFMEPPVPGVVLSLLQRYASIFFQMKVKLQTSVTFTDEVPKRRNSYSGAWQVNASNVLQEMTRILPKDAFCMGGITLCDLYPKDEWNFVFGLANSQSRCGVYSIARYLPTFGEKQAEHDALSVSTADLLELTCPLMTHEMCHMFGLKHCIFFNCLMNGSNHLDESRARPRFLCPVCLRKLNLSCGFDVVKRYRELLEFCSEVGMLKQEDWLRKRLQQLQKS